MQKIKIYIDLYDKLMNKIKRILILRIYSDTYNKNKIHEINEYSMKDGKYENNYKLDGLKYYYKTKYNSHIEDFYIEEYYLNGYDNDDITINNNTPMSPIDKTPMNPDDNPIEKLLNYNVNI